MGGMGEVRQSERARCAPDAARSLTSRTTSIAVASSVASVGTAPGVRLGVTTLGALTSSACTAALATPVGCGDGGSDVSGASGGGGAGFSEKLLLLLGRPVVAAASPATNASSEGWLVNVALGL